MGNRPVPPTKSVHRQTDIVMARHRVQGKDPIAGGREGRQAETVGNKPR